MRLSGTLRSWNDDRGYGFIAPTHGGAELFVHISALPKDGTRPTVGEKLTYELGRGKDGKPQAVNVVRQAIGVVPRHNSISSPNPGRVVSSIAKMLGLLLILALGGYGYKQYNQQTLNYSPTAAQTSIARETGGKQYSEPTAFNCDGRTHCSQMTSCAEAKFFLKNCPGTKMDGDNDGVPCEQQWCTNPFSK
jgi:cold shock CspA family protein